METTESMVPFAPTKGGQPSQLIHKKGNNYIFPPGTTEVDKYFGYVMNLTETVTYYDVQMRIHGIQSNLQAQAIKHLKTWLIVTFSYKNLNFYLFNFTFKNKHIKH